MKTVVVGSENPVKLETVKDAFVAMFPNEVFEFLPCLAMSGVADQPFGSAETKRGAEQRAVDCRLKFPLADFWVGLEGGVELDEGQYWVMAWMCVLSKEGKRGYGKTSSFQLPETVGMLIAEGKELGDATDTVFREKNSKQKGGVIGILTNGVVTRKDFYRDALIFALIPHVKSELYQ
jgi:inosine/xanthosine triphosphatase